jgi:malonyl-CoA/methylmalonyl-CoA synthetase
LPDCNLYSLFDTRFLAAGDRPALTHESATRSLTYAGLRTGAARYANALARLGVKPGGRVTVQVEKSVENVLLFLAVLKVGAVYQPLNTAYTPADVEYFVGDAKPSLVVCDPVREEALRAIVEEAGAGLATLGADGEGSLAEAAAAASPEHATVPRGTEDLAGLLYTSGTTGRSKGAMITHDNLASNILALHAIWAFRPGDVLLHALPIFHVHGLFVALGTAFLNGSEMLWHDRFDVARLMADLPRATVLMGVPTFYTRLLSREDFTAEVCRSIRLFVAGSAPLLAETHRAFEARTGHKVLERYGMTETGMITSNPYEGERRPGSVGYPLPRVEVRIADPEGRALGAGEIGVIEVRGPNVFKGYWGMPEKTRQEFRDGWFITGDMGVMEADGRVSIVGRAKDLIISGGFNVYPKEIEDAVDALPGVTESAVIGVPHPDFGEGVVAVVTGKPPAEAEMQAALQERLAKFKLPKRIFLVDELPRNAMGKVQKAELRKRFGDTFGQ